MKIVFLSDFLNHHQIPTSDELYSVTNGEYRFIQMECMNDERKGMGWTIEEEKIPYLVRYSDNPKNAQNLIESADVVIATGSVKYKYIINRIKRGGLLIKYDERPFKHSDHEFLFKPRQLRMMLKCHTACRDKNVYMLCAGAYVSDDMKRFFAYPGKMYKWGYFPEFHDYGIAGPKKRCGEKKRILWSGRLIEWKRPQMALELAEYLKRNKRDFEMTMIGTGELKEKISKEIEERNLKDYINLIDVVPHDEMYRFFLSADIFFMTSGRNEGWGAVLNEAMNQACVCVADRMAGAVPWLLKDKVNGFIYDTPQEAYDIVDSLFETKAADLEKIGRNAYSSILNGWTPRLAVHRLMEFIYDPDNYAAPEDGVFMHIEA